MPCADLYCEECMAKMPEPLLKPHRSSQRIYDSDRTQIAHMAFDFPHLERDYHNDLICNRCGLISDDPSDVIYLPDENRQKLANSDFGDEDDTDLSQYGTAYTGTNYYDHVFAAMHAIKLDSIVSLGGEAYEHRSWKDSVAKIGSKPGISRGVWPILQQCTKTGYSFYARALVRIDPDTGRREYFCQICSKAGLGKRAWHYWPIGKPRGYIEQGVLTAIQAASQEREKIGLNPPSIADIQSYAGGYWPVTPYVAGTGHFVLEGFNYSSVRDAIDLYVARGWIYTVNDAVTGSRRVLGGRTWSDLTVMNLRRT